MTSLPQHWVVLEPASSLAVQGPAIHVTNAQEVKIADNVIVHMPEHDNGGAAVLVDAVAAVRTSSSQSV